LSNIFLPRRVTLLSNFIVTGDLRSSRPTLTRRVDQGSDPAKLRPCGAVPLVSPRSVQDYALRGPVDALLARPCTSAGVTSRCASIGGPMRYISSSGRRVWCRPTCCEGVHSRTSKPSKTSQKHLRRKAILIYRHKKRLENCRISPRDVWTTSVGSRTKHSSQSCPRFDILLRDSSLFAWETRQRLMSPPWLSLSHRPQIWKIKKCDFRNFLCWFIESRSIQLITTGRVTEASVVFFFLSFVSSGQKSRGRSRGRN
jgi:hypothetical protein